MADLYTMGARPIQTLELHYPMIIHFLKINLNVTVVMINMSTLEWFFVEKRRRTCSVFM